MKKLLLASVAAAALLSSGNAFAGSRDWILLFHHDPLLTAAVASDEQDATVGGASIQGSVGSTETSNSSKSNTKTSSSSDSGSAKDSSSNSKSNLSAQSASHGGFDATHHSVSGGGASESSVKASSSKSAHSSSDTWDNTHSASDTSTDTHSYSMSYLPSGAHNYNNTDDSGNNASGIAMVNQNAGANSALQTNTTIAATLGGGSDPLVMGAVAIDSQCADAHGFSAEYNSSDTNSITGSFNGTSGIIEVNQNVAANSVLQSNTTIAANVASSH